MEGVKTDVGRTYEGIGLSIDKMLGNNLTADTASDTPVTGEWVLTGKKLESYLSMGKRKKKKGKKKSRLGNKGFFIHQNY